MDVKSDEGGSPLVEWGVWMMGGGEIEGLMNQHARNIYCTGHGLLEQTNNALKYFWISAAAKNVSRALATSAPAAASV